MCSPMILLMRELLALELELITVLHNLYVYSFISGREKSEDIYPDLQTCVSSVNKSDCLVVAGDFNARRDNTVVDDVMGWDACKRTFCFYELFENHKFPFFP